VQQAGKAKYLTDVEYRARVQFREENNLIEEDLKKIEEGHGIAPPPLLRPFRLENDLVHPEQVPTLPTRLRQLHQWYKSQDSESFGARYKHEHFHKGASILWVRFEYLYEFYTQSALDVHILALWCL
jgi:hypothetical protein